MNENRRIVLFVVPVDPPNKLNLSLPIGHLKTVVKSGVDREGYARTRSLLDDGYRHLHTLSEVAT